MEQRRGGPRWRIRSPSLIGSVQTVTEKLQSMPGKEEVDAISATLQGWLQKKLGDVEHLELSNFQSPKIGYSSTTHLFDLQFRRNGETTT